MENPRIFTYKKNSFYTHKKKKLSGYDENFCHQVYNGL